LCLVKKAAILPHCDTSQTDIELWNFNDVFGIYVFKF